VMRWRGRPPEPAGVREPRRPKPTLPAAAVALAEPPVRYAAGSGSPATRPL